jgi:hypothetical protein
MEETTSRTTKPTIISFVQVETPKAHSGFLSKASSHSSLDSLDQMLRITSVSKHAKPQKFTSVFDVGCQESSSKDKPADHDSLPGEDIPRCNDNDQSSLSSEGQFETSFLEQSIQEKESSHNKQGDEGTDRGQQGSQLQSQASLCSIISLERQVVEMVSRHAARNGSKKSSKDLSMLMPNLDCSLEEEVKGAETDTLFENRSTMETQTQILTMLKPQGQPPKQEEKPAFRAKYITKAGSFSA